MLTPTFKPPATFKLNLAAVPDITWRLGGYVSAVAATYVGTLMYHGIAAPDNLNNQLTLGGIVAAFLTCAARSALQSPAQSDAASARQTAALTTLASCALSDPVAMSLVQRLAQQLEYADAPRNVSTEEPRGPRPMSEIMVELEARLRQDMVATVMPTRSAKP